MLRPERMSRVSITGTRSHLSDVVETLHDLHLLHLVDYDGRWEGFDEGDPMPENEAVAERLVTVRAIESTLGIQDEDPTRYRTFTDDEIDERLATVREQVNELDDRRSDIEDRISDVESRLDAIEPFAALGIDLDLLTGHDHLQVVVGEGDPETIEAAIADAYDVYEVFEGDGVVAVAVPADAEDVSDVLLGADVSTLEIPEVPEEGSPTPSEYAADLERERDRLASELETVESELDDVRLEWTDFLLVAEEQLTTAVEKTEAPLSFATTDRAFVAAGWVPTDDYERLADRLDETLEGHVEVEELERADYADYADGHGEGHSAEAERGEGDHDEAGRVEDEAVATDGETAAETASSASEARADGGAEYEPLHGESPPVVMDNADPAKPFETLVRTVNQPKYSELDPTLVVFLTFPFAFGFMIGDIGYGLLYILLGWGCWKYFDSDTMHAMGWIAVWAGVFTTIFGYLYDDFLGIHMVDLGLHLPLAGTLSKGLHVAEVAQLWLVVAILFGVLHLSVGFLMGFVNDLHHGIREAAGENLSWLVALIGFFTWVFSTSEAGTLDAVATDLTATGSKPAFLVGETGVLYSNEVASLGFAGFPEPVGVAGLAAFLVGVVGVFRAEGAIGLIEVPTNVLAHSLSYLRITAVLLAKGGMAFVVNLLVFGAYEDHGHVVFDLPTKDVGGMHQEFAGLVHTEPLALTIPLAIFVFVFGHVLVMLLGITAAGIQMVRLEYVEFFQKFYQGGGEIYEPFGHEG